MLSYKNLISHIIFYMKNKKSKILITLFTNVIILSMLAFLGVVAFADKTKSVFNVENKNVYYHGNTNSNNVSLMINVYWGSEYIEDMLKTLDEHSIKATFFVGGLWVSKEPELLLKIFESGHEIANHGFYHKSQDKLSYEQNKNEILNNHKLVKSYLNIDMNLFAPPSGAYGNQTIKAANDLNYKVIMWTKDTIDWRDKDKNLIIKRASTKNKSGDLILMHPTKQTSEALSTIIDNILSQNLKIVTVSQNICDYIVWFFYYILL